MTFSLRTKLTIIFCAVTFLIMVVVGGLVVVVRDLAENIRKTEQLAARITTTDRLQLELSRLLVPLNDYLLTHDLKHRDRFDRSVGEISELLAELQRETDPRWVIIAREINSRLVELGTVAVEVLFIPRGDPNVIPLMERVNGLADQIIETAYQFHDLAKADIMAQEKTAAEKSAKVNRLLVALLVLVPAFMIVFYGLLTRWVTRPLWALHRGVVDLKAGRSSRTTVKTRDEIGEVAEAFNSLVDHLRESHEQVQRHTRQLESLYTASRALTKESSRGVLYQTLTDLARTLTESQYAVLALLNDEGRVIEVVESGVTPFSRRLEPGVKAVIAALPQSNEPLRMAKMSGNIPVTGLEDGSPLTTLLAVPIVADASLRARLYVMQKLDGVFSEADQDLVVTIARDASQSLKMIRLYEETERLAMMDGLTGFINRWAFEDRLKAECRRAGRCNGSFVLLFADMDHMKTINDGFGHATGDRALRHFSDAIRNTVRTTDVVGRYGGDEILVLMPDTRLDEALTVAERILRRLSGSPFLTDAQTMTITASLGIAAYPEHGREEDELLRAADHALYRAKADGRSRVRTFAAPTATTNPPRFP